ncbi:MAG: hypothetical protein HOA21_13500, partial [Rhodospirillaceae bacterium]|nr:hypothetical protein [Rhodospirillaceae bacterium]
MALFDIEPIHDDFGARITGIDLSEPLSAAMVEGIQAAIDDYSLLHFPDQPFDDDRQLAFTKALGEAEESHVTLGETG